jgi:hypothetical protein
VPLHLLCGDKERIFNRKKRDMREKLQKRTEDERKFLLSKDPAVLEDRELRFGLRETPLFALDNETIVFCEDVGELFVLSQKWTSP